MLGHNMHATITGARVSSCTAGYDGGGVRASKAALDLNRLTTFPCLTSSSADKCMALFLRC